MVKIISVDAVIGAGKTTLINEIFKHANANKFILVPEPVDLWMDIKNKNGDNILTAFYNDRSENALPLQLIALLTRRKLIQEKIQEALIKERENGEEVYLITERTVRSDYYIFAKSLHNEGYINEFGMIAYQLWNDVFSSESKTDKTIYLKLDTQICMERIKKRNREGEDKITMEYLNELYEAHETFFNEEMSKGKCYIYNNIYDCNTEEYMNEINRIVEFILN